MKWWLLLAVIAATLLCVLASAWPSSGGINWVAGEALLAGIACTGAALLVFDRIVPENMS